MAEFDFFNKLDFGTDFTKQNLGGYGTFSGEYLDPTLTSPISTSPINTQNLSGIQTAAPVDMIPAPIVPFINQGGDGIPTLAPKSTYNALLEDEVNQTDLEEAKKDSNVKNLINMGLFDEAKKYVKNNYGYIIMNVIFPGSGYAAKSFVENKKEKDRVAKENQRLADEINIRERDKQIKEIQKELGSKMYEIGEETDPYHGGKGGVQSNIGQTYSVPVSQAPQYTSQDRDRENQRGNGGGARGTSSSQPGGNVGGLGGHGPARWKEGGRIRYGEGGIVTL